MSSKQAIFDKIDDALDAAADARDLVGTRNLVHQLKLARHEFARKNASKA